LTRFCILTARDDRQFTFFWNVSSNRPTRSYGATSYGAGVTLLSSTPTYGVSVAQKKCGIPRSDDTRVSGAHDSRCRRATRIRYDRGPFTRRSESYPQLTRAARSAGSSLASDRGGEAVRASLLVEAAGVGPT